ncbi:MAG TPA: HEAT repeat domain-containing protein [Clostridia bacterium]|nr:HEAT repeat domain-containing protein [Clostridia bacterium]
MRKRIKIMAVVLIFVLGGVIGLQIRGREHEPVCEGKPLSYWLYLDAIPSLDDRSNLDTNAVPFLTQAIQKRETRVGRAYQRLFPKLPSFIKGRVPRPRFASVYRVNALRCLRLLAREQPSVAPLIGRALVQALQTNEDPGVRCQAAEVLTSLDRNDAQVASQLCEAVINEKDPRVRAYVAYQLRFFERQPEMVVSALTDRLIDNDPRVRTRAAESLLAMKANARVAVPIFIAGAQ